MLQLVSSTGFYGTEQMICLLTASLEAEGADTCVGMFNASDPQCSRFNQRALQQETPVWDLRCNGRLDLKAFRMLVRFLREEHVDVVHTHGYKANLYGWVGARLAGCVVVATCHNWTDRTSSLRSYALLDRMLLKRFDMVAGVSREIVSRLRVAGVPKKLVRLIANGIDVSRYKRESSVTLPGPTVLGCISRLSKEKGVDVLLWALPKILSKHPGVQCVVAGEGVERERLQELADTLGVSHSFHMPGFCEDTPEFLRRCTLIVQPSRMEAMPLAVLEAMAAGKAIVASAVGEIPRLLEDGDAGSLVPPGQPDLLADAILTLLADPAMRHRLEERSEQKAARQFDASVTTRKYMQMYQAALRANRRLARTLAATAGLSR